MPSYRRGGGSGGGGGGGGTAAIADILTSSDNPLHALRMTRGDWDEEWRVAGLVRELNNQASDSVATTTGTLTVTAAQSWLLGAAGNGRKIEFRDRGTLVLASQASATATVTGGTNSPGFTVTPRTTGAAALVGTNGNNWVFRVETAATQVDATVTMTNVGVQMTIPGGTYNGWTVVERYATSAFADINVGASTFICQFDQTQTLAENIASLNASAAFSARAITLALTSGTDGTTNPPTGSITNVDHIVSGGVNPGTRGTNVDTTHRVFTLTQLATDTDLTIALNAVTGEGWNAALAGTNPVGPLIPGDYTLTGGVDAAYGGPLEMTRPDAFAYLWGSGQSMNRGLRVRINPEHSVWGNRGYTGVGGAFGNRFSLRLIQGASFSTVQYNWSTGNERLVIRYGATHTLGDIEAGLPAQGFFVDELNNGGNYYPVAGDSNFSNGVDDREHVVRFNGTDTLAQISAVIGADAQYDTSVDTGTTGSRSIADWADRTENVLRLVLSLGDGVDEQPREAIRNDAARRYQIRYHASVDTLGDIKTALDSAGFTTWYRNLASGASTPEDINFSRQVGPVVVPGTGGGGGTGITQQEAQALIADWAETGDTTPIPAAKLTNAGGGASLSDATPQAPGTAAAGTSSDASRADHVHPKDSTKQDSLPAIGNNQYWRTNASGVLQAQAVPTGGGSAFDLHEDVTGQSTPADLDRFVIADVSMADQPNRYVTLAQIRTAIGAAAEEGARVWYISSGLGFSGTLTRSSLLPTPDADTDVRANDIIVGQQHIVRVNSVSGNSVSYTSIFSRGSFDVRDDVTTAATPADADRFIFSDEDVAGDPMRYVTFANLKTAIGTGGGTGNVTAAQLAAALEAVSVDRTTYADGTAITKFEQDAIPATSPDIEQKSFTALSTAERAGATGGATIEFDLLLEHESGSGDYEFSVSVLQGSNGVIYGPVYLPIAPVGGSTQHKVRFDAADDGAFIVRTALTADGAQARVGVTLSNVRWIVEGVLHDDAVAIAEGAATEVASQLRQDLDGQIEAETAARVTADAGKADTDLGNVASDIASEAQATVRTKIGAAAAGSTLPTGSVAYDTMEIPFVVSELTDREEVIHKLSGTPSWEWIAYDADDDRFWLSDTGDGISYANLWSETSVEINSRTDVLAGSGNLASMTHNGDNLILLDDGNDTLATVTAIPSSGAPTVVNFTTALGTDTWVGVAWDAANSQYIVVSSDEIYTVTTAGVKTLVRSHAISNLVDIAFLGSQLYGLVGGSNRQGQLYTIDPTSAGADAKVKDLASTDSASDLYGLTADANNLYAVDRDRDAILLIALPSSFTHFIKVPDAVARRAGGTHQGEGQLAIPENAVLSGIDAVIFDTGVANTPGDEAVTLPAGSYEVSVAPIIENVATGSEDNASGRCLVEVGLKVGENAIEYGEGSYIRGTRVANYGTNFRTIAKETCRSFHRFTLTELTAITFHARAEWVSKAAGDNEFKRIAQRGGKAVVRRVRAASTGTPRQAALGSTQQEQDVGPISAQLNVSNIPANFYIGNFIFDPESDTESVVATFETTAGDTLDMNDFRPVVKQVTSAGVFQRVFSWNAGTVGTVTIPDMDTALSTSGGSAGRLILELLNVGASLSTQHTIKCTIRQYDEPREWRTQIITLGENFTFSAGGGDYGHAALDHVLDLNRLQYVLFTWGFRAPAESREFRRTFVQTKRQITRFLRDKSGAKRNGQIAAYGWPNQISPTTGPPDAFQFTDYEDVAAAQSYPGAIFQLQRSNDVLLQELDTLMIRGNGIQTAAFYVDVHAVIEAPI